MAKQTRYQLLLADDTESEVSMLELGPRRSLKTRWLGALTYSICILSLLVNIVFAALQLSDRTGHDISLFAGASRDIQIPWTHEGPYWNDSEESTRKMWEDLDISAGTVALTNEYVESMGLPASQRFPWDESKGIYILNAWHALHCLKRLHTAILEAKHGRVQSRPWDHTLHCIDALRQDAICHADDTPRYTGEGSPSGTSGINQYRKCRDWSKVEKWAKKHTACWRYVNGSDATIDTLERYKYCPPGSPYNERIYRVFGLPEKWKNSGY